MPKAEASVRPATGLLGARWHNAVHAQILDHLPIMVESVRSYKGCDNRPRVQTIDAGNSNISILRSDRRNRLVRIGERIRGSLQKIRLRRQTLDALSIDRCLFSENL